MDFTRETVQTALERAPALRTFLLRAARAAAQGRPQGRTFSVQGLDYAAQGELERLLGRTLKRTPAGRVCGEFPEALRAPSAWRGAMEVLGVSPENAGEEPVETFFGRLRLLLPEQTPLVSALGEMPEVLRHVRDAANRPAWQRLLVGVVSRVRSAAESTTLSQLGAEWLNDSKALRTGPLRRQLVLILSALDGHGVDDERTLLAIHGVFDNPYTSFATLFAPFSFTTDAGDVFDFPARLFAAGQACVLAGETVAHMKSVSWLGPSAQIVTSENAAPFARLVAAGRPALYTEGYPNLSVQRVLSLLSAAGVTAEHAGDADLDGLRIADMVARRITVRRVVASEILRCIDGLSGIPLTAAQRVRAEKAVAADPGFPYAADVRRMLELGAWYEQETFPL